MVEEQAEVLTAPTETEALPKQKKIITLKPIAPKEPEPERFCFFDGPFSDCGESRADGDESPFWTVKVATDMDEEGKYSYKVWNFTKAYELAEKISNDQNIELISCAVTA